MFAFLTCIYDIIASLVSATAKYYVYAEQELI